MPVIRLELRGPVPSKKNLYRRAQNGRMFLDHDVKAQIVALTMQARRKWKGPPLIHPEVDVEFFVLNRRSDRDNKLGCLLDVLQDAGVISKDNVAQFNGTMCILPAVVGNVEGVIVDLLARQDILEAV